MGKRRWTGLLLGACVLLSAAAVSSPLRARQRRRLAVVLLNVAEQADVPLDAVLIAQFNAKLTAQSGDAIRVLGRDDRTGEFTVPVTGRSWRVGKFLYFEPAYPTHVRNLADPAARFHAPGTPEDLWLGGCLRPSTRYRVDLLGRGEDHVARSRARGRLRRTTSFEFTTAPDDGSVPLFDPTQYRHQPPFTVSFTNPPDRVVSVADQFVRLGGTPQVPAAISVSLFETGTPLDPASVRAPGAVTLSVVSRAIDGQSSGPVVGTANVEQDRDNVRVVFEPRSVLPDRATLVLRVSPGVTDLTGAHTHGPDADRLRLTQIFEHYDAARQLDPLTPPELLPLPPAELVRDWPESAALRGVSITNLLALGDASSPEIDPTVCVIFTTRDEPVANAVVDFGFDATDGLRDSALTSADWDRAVPGAASPRFLEVGGDQRDGDFVPTADTVLSLDDFADHTARFDTFHIPAGVIVRVVGSRPGRILASRITVDGELRLDGGPGEPAPDAADNQPWRPRDGGAGALGGGDGGAASAVYADGVALVSGAAGGAAEDESGGAAGSAVAGAPGLGGTTGTGAMPLFGGGGGGGGGLRPGKTGATSTDVTQGAGGVGGVAADGGVMSLLFGGNGGGAGGNGVNLGGALRWSGAGGGGGGGGIELRTLEGVEFGAAGRVTARGGAGGDGAGVQFGAASGPGGGGSGGAILVRTVGTFAFDGSEATAFDVDGGAGGAQTGAGVADSGGYGGAGSVRLESPAAGSAVPGATTGVYAPLGGAAGSAATSRFVALAVFGARFADPSAADVTQYVADGEAVLVELQLARGAAGDVGSPDTAALDEHQDSTDESRVSAWLPFTVVDRSGVPGGAFGALPGFDPATQTSATFPIAAAANGKGFSWMRVRVRFRPRDGRSATDATSYVDRVRVRLDFN